MNLKQKIRIIMYVFIAMMFVLTVKAKAASLSVSSSKSSVTPGEEFTVTISASGATGKAFVSVSGGTASKSSVWLDPSESVNIKAGNSGSVTISVSAAEKGTRDSMSDSSGGDIQPSPASATVSIKSSNNGGSNNGGSTNNGGNTNTGNGGTTDSAPTLSNLGIRPNDFKGFTPGKKQYSVTVPADCTSIEVYASSKNGTVSGTGTKTLKNGTNRFDVTVSNGSKKTTYTILVTKKSDEDGETPPNTIDEENPDETIQEGIGLASLEIEGYTLDKEFKTDLYEYTVKDKKQLK